MLDGRDAGLEQPKARREGVYELAGATISGEGEGCTSVRAHAVSGLPE